MHGGVGAHSPKGRDGLGHGQPAAVASRGPSLTMDTRTCEVSLRTVYQRYIEKFRSDDLGPGRARHMYGVVLDAVQQVAQLIAFGGGEAGV